jgi:hypothetical protein
VEVLRKFEIQIH